MCATTILAYEHIVVFLHLIESLFVQVSKARISLLYSAAGFACRRVPVVKCFKLL